MRCIMLEYRKLYSGQNYWAMCKNRNYKISPFPDNRHFTVCFVGYHKGKESSRRYYPGKDMRCIWNYSGTVLYGRRQCPWFIRRAEASAADVVYSEAGREELYQYLYGEFEGKVISGMKDCGYSYLPCINLKSLFSLLYCVLWQGIFNRTPGAVL